MGTIPQFLYLFQTIPLKIPQSYLRKLWHLFPLFLWNNELYRLQQNFNTLQGMRWGSVFHTPLFTRKQQFLPGFHHSSTKQWVHIDNFMTSLEIMVLPWIHHKQQKNKECISDLIQILSLWDHTVTGLQISCYFGPITTPILWSNDSLAILLFLLSYG